MGQQAKIGNAAGDQVFVPGMGVVDRATAESIDTAGIDVGVHGAPGQSVGFHTPNEPADVRADQSNQFGSFVRGAIPQVAGMAASFVPPLAGVRGAFAVPTVVDAVMQLLNGESIDPMKAAFNGALGVAGHAAGAAAKLPGGYGRTMVRNTIAPGVGPVASDRLVNTAVKESADLSPAGIAALVRRSVDLENAANNLTGINKSKAMREVANVDELTDTLRRTPASGGGNIPTPRIMIGGSSPRASAGSTGGVLTPRQKLKAGVGMAQFAEGNAPITIESVVRALEAGGMGEAQVGADDAQAKRLKFQR